MREIPAKTYMAYEKFLVTLFAVFVHICRCCCRSLNPSSALAEASTNIALMDCCWSCGVCLYRKCSGVKRRSATDMFVRSTFNKAVRQRLTTSLRYEHHVDPIITRLVRLDRNSRPVAVKPVRSIVPITERVQRRAIY